MPHMGNTASVDASLVRDVIVPFVAMGTFLWAVYSARRGWLDGLALRKVDFIRSYTGDFYAAPELPELVFAIDYGRFSMTEADLGTKREIELDHLLDFLNTVGLAVHEGLMQVADLRQTTIGYAARIVWEDTSVRWYLRHIEGHDLETGKVAFAYFRELGERLAGR